MFFKQPQHKRFNLQPRYWDPQKEEREKREKRIKAELGLAENDDQHIPDIRGKFRQEYEKRKAARGNVFSSYTLRLFMILIMLFMAVLYVIIKNPEGIMRFFGL